MQFELLCMLAVLQSTPVCTGYSRDVTEQAGGHCIYPALIKRDVDEQLLISIRLKIQALILPVALQLT